MENICDRLKMDMELKNYSPHTRTCYLARVGDFLRHFDRSPEELDKEDIRAYLHYLIKEKKVSQSFITQAYSALKFFCETTLGRDWDGVRIPRMKRTRRLPVVLSRQEVRAIFSVVKNLKHRAMLATIYSGGLRVSEAVHLKVSDIDSGRMMIRIGHGKRGKDRYTLLAKHTLEILREYWSVYRPVDWLFPGRPPTRPLSTKAVQLVFRKALPRAGIKKPATVHTLRHTFATDLLEAGTDLCHIQHLLGHRRLETTAIYLHLSRKDIGRIVSPLDLMMESDG